MSALRSLLERWARRKSEACAPWREADRSVPGQDQVAPAGNTAPPVKAQQSVDPASLPSIESIDAETDLRVFLGEGVPAEVTLAALRRGWSADLSIRDFVGLSENSWDFNATGEMPGFGCLEPEDIRRLAAKITGPAEATGDIVGQSAAPVQVSAASIQSMDSGLNPERWHDAAPADLNSDLDIGDQLEPSAQSTGGAGTDAETQIGQHPSNQQSLRQRRHGGAMPRID